MIHVKWHLHVVLENLRKILIDVTHHEEYAQRTRLFCVLFLRNDHVKHFNSKYVIFHGRKSPQNRNFSVNSFYTEYIIECISDIFYGNCSIISFMSRFDYLPEAALALYLNQLIFLCQTRPDGWQALFYISRLLSLLHFIKYYFWQNWVIMYL